MINGYLIAGVAVDNTAFSFDRIFSYQIPNHRLELAKIGKRVLVPFGKGNRTRQGMIISLTEEECLDENTKAVSSFLDDEPILTEEMIKTVLFIHDRYYCTYYEAVRVMLPTGLNYKIITLYSAKKLSEEQYSSLNPQEKTVFDFVSGHKKPVSKDIILTKLPDCEGVLTKISRDGFIKRADDAFRHTGDSTVKMVALCDDTDSISLDFTPKQQKVIDLVATVGKVSVKEICYYTGFTTSVIDTLVRKKILYYFQDEVMRNPYSGADYSKQQKPLVLSDSQQSAFESLLSAYNSVKASVSLLYGVTGSGKTSVFMKLIEQCFNDGKGTILMVPEIALTPQLVRIFVGRFGDNVAVFHSGLSIGERLDEFKRVKRGEAKIVLGTRSAVFAPLDNIGLIVLDEEQEGSYKSQQTPRFHARDIAKFRCSCHNALLLLSSATPNIESFYMAERGVYNLVRLNARYGNSKLPEVSVVDMNEEAFNGNFSNYSSMLKNKLEYNLENGSQSIILLNRRGCNTFVSCRSCGEVVTCPNCSISLTYHSANNRLMCHYCGYSVAFSEECPDCHSHSLRLSGAGTQKAEQELLDMFPTARVLRMDADATMTKSSYETKLTAFANGEYDILIGTQMVAKGLDFPNVTLVGVLNADQMLYSDDFRSYERAFSLLTQVVGRSGRGNQSGSAVIQTYTPENQVISMAASQDYDRFYKGEILLRKALLYPPFADICLISFSGADEEKTKKCVNDFYHEFILLVKEKYSSLPLRVLTPGPSSVYKISNKFRYKIILKCRNTREFRTAMNDMLKEYSAKKDYKKITISVDMNPLSFN
ncbi:MAG: primosomal protein N' [Ruminococcus sp.]|nr:primosomal protein N' [Ruminococcus sp.]